MAQFPAEEGVRSVLDSGPSSRRAFLGRIFAATVAAGAASSVAEAALPAGEPAGSRVALVRDRLLRGPQPGVSAARGPHTSNAPDPARLAGLLDRAMQGIFAGEHLSDASGPWKRLFHPGERVGIKVNALGGRGLSSNVQLVESICSRLQQAGIRARDIVVWDRDSAELQRAGFTLRMGGDQVQCFGSDRTGFTEELFAWGEVGSRLSRILTDSCDALINVPVLKDHDGAGVSLALKNMYGAIHNPNKYHPNGCDPYVADLNMLPQIRGKLRLHICDATAACYHGGPAFKPEFTWHENALIVSRDPVALDTIGRQLIEKKRAEKSLPTLEAEKRPPRYIATAADADHRLGNHDLRRIQLAEEQIA